MADELCPALVEQHHAKTGSIRMAAISCRVDGAVALDDLMNECEILLNAGMAALEEAVDLDSTGAAMWPTLMTLRLARVAFHAAYERVHVESMARSRGRA